MVRFTVLLAALLATPVLAQDDVKPIKDPDKRVCRTEVPTGSIMAAKKECHTKAEWAQIARANGHTVDHWRDNRKGGGMDNGGGFRPGS